MNKTLKKILIFILLLIIVVLVIFLIEIILPNNNAGEPAPVTPSASVKPSPAPSATGASPSAPPSPSPSDQGSVTTEETADGTKYSVTVPDSFISYTITADSGLFLHSRDNGSDIFTSKTEERTLLNISFVQGAKAANIAPGYLDAFIDYTEFEQSGKNYIDGTMILGETVTAGDGVSQVTAWLVDTDNGVLAVVMSLAISNKADELPKLDKVLSTLTVGE
jgi:hypothetical protein